MIIVSALIAIAVIVSTRNLPADPILPSPNGYDDFIKAGQIAFPDTSSFKEMDHEQLRAFVAKNSEALAQVRVGLSRQSLVPLSDAQTNMAGHMTSLGKLKMLAQALNAEGLLAEMEHRDGDAMRSYVDIIKFSNEATRGGPLIDALVKVACETYGVTALQTLTTNLNASQCREIVSTLESIEKKQETVTDIFKNQKEWSRGIPYYKRLIGSITGIFNGIYSKKTVQSVTLKFQMKDKLRRELMIQVAVRAFELEKGERPKNISGLTPDYLKAIPADPFTGTNMVLKP